MQRVSGRPVALAGAMRRGSLMRIPTHILHAATGSIIPEATLLRIQQQRLATAPGTGGEDCLKLCNLVDTVVSGLSAPGRFKQHDEPHSGAAAWNLTPSANVVPTGLVPERLHTPSDKFPLRRLWLLAAATCDSASTRKPLIKHQQKHERNNASLGDPAMHARREPCLLAVSIDPGPRLVMERWTLDVYFTRYLGVMSLPE